jgi:prepilin-type N-terminal cleavage/methylation domain-containing protein
MSTAQSQPLPEAGGVIGAEGRSKARRTVAFTLIELLVVISIIGVLASLTVGLTGVATRRSKESRVRAEMTKLVNAIENYKTALGYYPPDHRVTDLMGREVGLPSPNQLFYELSGTVYKDTAPLGPRFYVAGRDEFLTAAQVESQFNAKGIANAARDQKDLKFTEEFKGSQYKRIKDAPIVDVLAVPVSGPKNRRTYDPTGPVTWELTVNKTQVNPWLYISTSPTNNPDRYDLWTEVVIGGKTIRFSNWEKDPVVLSP